jgi:large subunit ribosomal protein L35
MPGRLSNASQHNDERKRSALAGSIILKGSEMPKMKTKSGAKKRFKITGTGKVLFAQAGKRHGMIKRTKKFIRQARGTSVLCDADAGIVKQFLPYGKA